MSPSRSDGQTKGEFPVNDGPYYDDLTPGQVFPVPGGVTIDAGLAATYLAISGDGQRLALDHELCRAVTGRNVPLANATLVMHLSVGASTVATKRVIANLFYRNVVVRRPVFQGETLQTTTRVIGMADASAKSGVGPRGKVLLGMQTIATATGELIIDYERCPLLPCRGETAPGHHDVLGAADSELDLQRFVPGIDSSWKVELLGPHDTWPIGETRSDDLRDVVDQATALVRISHNVAAAHRDAERSPYDRRLVYGGHAIALASASLNRVLGGLVTVVGWQSCNHLAPVFEGDTLSFRHTLIDQQAVGAGWCRAIRIQVDAHRTGVDPVPVLDWMPICHTS